jgi:hypothetical protein
MENQAAAVTAVPAGHSHYRSTTSDIEGLGR